MSDLTLTIGETEDGRMLAIVSSGGHPQNPGSGVCTVQSVEVVESRKEAKAWFERMKAERPWEIRQ